MEPEFQEFALKCLEGAGRGGVEGGFELHPVGRARGGFGIPYLEALVGSMHCWGRRGLTCVDLSADDERGFPNACLDDGTVLCGVVDDLVFPPFDVFAGRRVPGVGEEAEGFEFVAWEVVSMCIVGRSIFIEDGKGGTHPSTTSCLDLVGRGLFGSCFVELGIVLCKSGFLRYICVC